MNIEGLIASAAINIGLALVVLWLFSVLKKQPLNAAVYYARRLARREDHVLSSVLYPGFHIRRFLPSVSWISRAFYVTEEEVLREHGLDALVVVRLFKLGIQFFMVCSVVGLVILVPVNYTSHQDQSQRELPYSMDPFTISNIKAGSNWLWVHFSCLCFVSLYALYLSYEEYKVILKRRIQQLHIQRLHAAQFTVLVRGVPLCSEHKARACCVDHFFSKHYLHFYQACQILYSGENLEDLIKLAASLDKKINNMMCRQISNNDSSKSLITRIFGDNVGQMENCRERLQELCQKIRHLQCESFLKQKELPVAFVLFKTRQGAALAAQSQQHDNPLLWITEPAPEARDIMWNNLAIPFRRLALHKIGAFIAASVLTIFFTIPVTAVQGIARLQKLQKWFPPLKAVQLIPGLSSVLTGYLPSVILNCFIYIVPYVMVWISSLEGCISRSKTEIKACSMVFYFLMGNVFFLSVLSGSLLDQIGESFFHPREIPSRLATAVSSQADFFMTYILTDGLSGFSLEILQLGLVTLHFIGSHLFGQEAENEQYLYTFPYYRVIPFVSLAILIGMVYSVITPLLLPFLIVYFLIGYAVYMNQMQDVYEIVYETYGQYWPCIHHYIFVTVILTQVTMAGLFGLKAKPSASFSTIPLLFMTILFNEYCKARFLPTFYHYSIQSAMENDECDASEGEMEGRQRNMISQYRPPWLRPMNFSSTAICNSTEPLII